MAKNDRRAKAKAPGKIRQAAGKTLRGISLSVLVTLLAAVFGLIVIMSEPKTDGAALTDQPLTAAAPAVTIQDETDLPELMASFPTAILTMLPVDSVTFAGAASYDVPFEGGVARVAEVSYTLEDGGTLTLTTIYPARAESLIGRDGYAIIGSTELAGLPAIRMSREDSVRVHAQHAEALYVLTAPSMPFGDLSALAKSAQRMSLMEE